MKQTENLMKLLGLKAQLNTKCISSHVLEECD